MSLVVAEGAVSIAGVRRRDHAIGFTDHTLSSWTPTAATEFWQHCLMAVAIREPRPDEASTIADLHVTTWKQAYSHLLPAGYFSEEYIAGRHRMWHHVLTHPRDDTLVRVAEIDGETVGFAWVGPGEGVGGGEPPRDRLLYAIYVLASHHGAGVGQALLDATLGDDPAMLWVAKENPRAMAFYARNGFRFDGVEQVDPEVPAITGARMVR